MKAYLVIAWSVPQAVFPSRENAERFVNSGMHFRQPLGSDEYQITEIECLSYDEAPESAFARAWNHERRVNQHNIPPTQAPKS